jgi:hypothetical protein
MLCTPYNDNKTHQEEICEELCLNLTQFAVFFRRFLAEFFPQPLFCKLIIISVFSCIGILLGVNTWLFGLLSGNSTHYSLSLMQMYFQKKSSNLSSNSNKIFDNIPVINPHYIASISSFYL